MVCFWYPLSRHRDKLITFDDIYLSQFCLCIVAVVIAADITYFAKRFCFMSVSEALNHHLHATVHQNTAIFELICAFFWPYRAPIKISWWYLKRFRSYCIGCVVLFTGWFHRCIRHASDMHHSDACLMHRWNQLVNKTTQPLFHELLRWHAHTQRL